MRMFDETYSMSELAREAGRGILYLIASCALAWIFLVIVGA
jgi:hypothetical protein